MITVLKYLILNLVFGAIIYYILLIPFPELDFYFEAFVDFLNIFGLVGNTKLIFVTVVLFLVYFLGTFISTFFINLFVKLFNGKGTIFDTYKAFTYGITPQLFLIAVPILNIFSRIYMFYLQIIGLSKLQKFSVWKSVWSFVLGGISMSIVFVILGIIGLILSKL